MKNKPFSIGIVIFVKNEAQTIGTIIDQIAMAANRHDIFVVDGHSTDDTRTIVRERKVNFSLDNGRGKGAAIRLAIDTIERDILVFMDSDGCHQPQEILALIDPFEIDRDVAMVVGSRFKGGSDELSNSPSEIFRKIGNKLSTLIINTRWHASLTDTQNGFRAVRRSAVLALDLKENSFAIEQELTMKCLKKGVKIVEVPSYELKREYGRSHVVVWKMLPRYIWCFIRNVFI